MINEALVEAKQFQWFRNTIDSTTEKTEQNLSLIVSLLHYVSQGRVTRENMHSIENSFSCVVNSSRGIWVHCSEERKNPLTYSFHFHFIAIILFWIFVFRKIYSSYEPVFVIMMFSRTSGTFHKRHCNDLIEERERGAVFPFLHLTYLAYRNSYFDHFRVHGREIINNSMYYLWIFIERFDLWCSSMWSM